MQMTEQSKPWHKHPLVWMMIAIPFSAVIMGVVMIWLALDTDDGLVADDYYKQGLEINDVISLDRKATELKLSAVINFDSTGKVINFEFDKGLLESYPDTLQLNFQHATHAGSDVHVVLNHGIDDQYIGYLQQVISEGVWYFEVSDADWKLNARNYVRAKNVIQLQSEQ
jgi:hypothetical protein